MQLRNEWTFVIDIVRLDNFEYCCDKHEIRKVMFWYRGWMKKGPSFKQFSDSYTCTYQTLFIRWCYNIGITQMLGHWCTIKCNRYCLHLLIVLDLTRFVLAALFVRGLILLMCFMIEQPTTLSLLWFYGHSPPECNVQTRTNVVFFEPDK